MPRIKSWHRYFITFRCEKGIFQKIISTFEVSFRQGDPSTSVVSRKPRDPPCTQDDRFSLNYFFIQIPSLWI